MMKIKSLHVQKAELLNQKINVVKTEHKSEECLDTRNR